MKRLRGINTHFGKFAVSLKSMGKENTFGGYKKFDEAVKVNRKVRELWQKGKSKSGQMMYLSIEDEEIDAIREAARKELQN